MAAVTICSDFGAQENKVCYCFHCFPSICHEEMGSNAMILVFWMLSYKPTFSLFSFTFFKRLFSSSLLSAIRVVSSSYLRLLLFLPASLTPACASLQVDSLPTEPPVKPKNTEVCSLSFLQGIFLTQELNQGLLHCRQILYQLSYKLPALNIIEQIQVSFFMAMKGKSN